jgi:thymidylate synthase
LTTVELINCSFEVPCDKPGNTFYTGYTLLDALAQDIQPNREWADEHFMERVGGVPYNPDPSHVRWPHWHGQDDSTKVRGEFTHTYSERFWPWRVSGLIDGYTDYEQIEGIRYNYGDYNDLLSLMIREPMGRQAYLPIFFPEDTGAVHGGRIPCTLGYHFLQRNNYLHLWYDIRSCDLYRHLRDDVYLAVRLMLHTLDKLSPSEDWESVRPGTLYFNAHSLHIHKGDWHHVFKS